MQAKLHLGFYMYAPRLGGAEGYLRELLCGLDREQFDVTLFAPEWDAFDHFLGLERNQSINRVKVNVREPGTRSGSAPAHSRGVGPGLGYGDEAAPSRLRMLSKRVPFGARAAPAAQWILRQAYWQPDLRNLTRAFASKPVDLLHSVNGGYPGATSARSAVVAAARAGIRGRVLTVCSTAAPRTGVAPIERFLDDKVSAAADAVIVPAERPRMALVEKRGFRREQVVIIPWGIDAPAQPADQQAARAAARSQLGLPQDRQIVGTLGNFTPTKGHWVVVEAVARLAAAYPGVLGVIGGEGPERAAVEALSRTLGVGDRVRFIGATPDAFTFLRSLDVFVLASEIEGLPLVVLEAMSQCVPVVATDVGGIPDAVESGVGGYLVAPRDPAAVADAVGRLLKDPVAAAAMAVAARRDFDRRFTTAIMLRDHQDLYRRVLQRHLGHP